MSYAEKYLKAHGRTCTINRIPVVTSKVSIKRSTRASRDLGVREGYWEGLILADAALQSGEVLTIADDRGTENYLVQSVNTDYASTEHAFFSAKCNAVIQHKRKDKTIDENNNPVMRWDDVNPDMPNIDAYVEVVTYTMRQYDPGLLEQTRYLVQVPKLIGAEKLDRFVLEDGNCEVVSINNAGLHGVSILQLGIDLRP